jgi:hypothetical protein
MTGAIIAKAIADQYPFAQRPPFWIGGTVIIFIGLWILSLGTKSRLLGDDRPTSENDERDGP